MQKWRVEVFKETKFAVEALKYTIPKTDKVVNLDATQLKAGVDGARFYENGSALPIPTVPEKQKPPTVTVVDGDCLLEGLSLKSQGFNPVVLNMASDRNPGGGYKSGAGAQEENLFRRTNLYQYHEPQKESWYPIPQTGGIYCPNAIVLRGSEQEQYEWLETPQTISFVAVAALRRPKLITTEDGVTLTPEAKIMTRKKIKTILNIGLAHGHDAIVLSAFGCGAFSNPPKVLAQLFYEVLSNDYAGGDKDPKLTYRHISFAIFDDKNTSKKHNPDGNLYPFQQRFTNGLAVGGVEVNDDNEQRYRNYRGRKQHYGNASSSNQSERRSGHGNFPPLSTNQNERSGHGNSPPVSTDQSERRSGRGNSSPWSARSGHRNFSPWSTNQSERRSGHGDFPPSSTNHEDFPPLLSNHEDFPPLSSNLPSNKSERRAGDKNHASSKRQITSQNESGRRVAYRSTYGNSSPSQPTLENFWVKGTPEKDASNALKQTKGNVDDAPRLLSEISQTQDIDVDNTSSETSKTQDVDNTSSETSKTQDVDNTSSETSKTQDLDQTLSDANMLSENVSTGEEKKDTEVDGKE